LVVNCDATLGYLGALAALWRLRVAVFPTISGDTVRPRVSPTIVDALRKACATEFPLAVLILLIAYFMTKIGLTRFALLASPTCCCLPVQANKYPFDRTFTGLRQLRSRWPAPRQSTSTAPGHFSHGIR
jgi:hypothetical protein